jgi:hypothetical protein
VKNIQKEAVPLKNIERHPLMLLAATGLSAAIIFWGYVLLKDVNPWGFIVMVPGAIVSFQALWWLLNPFALVFDDKIEIKQSLFHHKDRYFIDLKRISEPKPGKLYITYHDDEVEYLNLFGIRPSHISLLKSEVERGVSQIGTAGA